MRWEEGMQRATQTFHVGTENGTRTITAGDLLEDGDPIVKGREIYFKPTDESKAAKKTPARRTPAKSTAKKDD
jgi:hypothetical protein